MSNLESRRVPPLSDLTMVKFETAPSLSKWRTSAILSAAMLVLALMFAATKSERGLAQPGLGPCRSDAMLSVPIGSFEEGTVVFTANETMWFVVGPQAFAGENDGMAAESEIAGWAAEMSSGNHAVEKTGDMSDLALLTMRPQMSGRSTITAAAFVGFFMKDTAATGCGRLLSCGMFSALSVACERSRCLPRMLSPCVFSISWQRCLLRC